jgi:hypothetical protein
MTLVLDVSVGLDRLRAGLKARNWTITSHLVDRLEAKRGPYVLAADDHSISFSGFLPAELFGSDADKEKVGLVGAVLGLIPARS